MGNSPKFIEPMFMEAHLGLRIERGGQAFVDGHVLAAAGGDVDDRIGPFRDARQELAEHLRVGRRLAGPRVAGVEVDDRRARLGRADDASTISAGVMGRCGDIVGVWMEPVTAHVMMTLSRGATMQPSRVPFASRC